MSAQKGFVDIVYQRRNIVSQKDSIHYVPQDTTDAVVQN
jgi:hypothetical protein